MDSSLGLLAIHPLPTPLSPSYLVGLFLGG